MDSFLAKIGWKWPRKREYKTYRSVPFRSYSLRNRKFQKNSNKVENLKYTIMASFQTKISWKRTRKRKNKNYRFVPFYTTRNRKF